MSISPGTSTTTPAITGISTRTTTLRRSRRSRRGAPPGVVFLLALAAWALFALAGAYQSTTIPVIIGAFALAALVRPRILDRHYLLIDAGLLSCVAVVVVQLIPVPPDIRSMVSPGAADVEAALLLVYNGAAEPAWRPLSLDPAATRWALAAALSLMFVFWTTRSLLERGGGLRGLARGLAWIGLALAGVMLVQKALAPQHIYGIISPTSRTTSPAPHGPFVNRNDYAMWVAMVTPVVIGYILARLASRQTSNGSVRVAAALDERMIWLCASATLLSASLLASLSRGGLMGMMAALLVLVALSRRRLSGVHVRTLVAALGVLLAVGTLYANIPALAERFGATLPSGLGGRLTLWREAWPMVPDFPIAGVGVGAFQRGMLVYQRSTRLIFFNHAHNEYLQLLIEGGLLLVIPAAVVIAAGASGIVRELRQDGTAMFWVRAGAAAGLVAAAVQSVWDTGLRMPANGVVFAILAAVAIHRVTAAGDGGDRSA